MQIEIPDLVIENCSSGGHRLEPSMMALSSMASFSDAHESPEIPIIAANMHRMILPRQSQIWAVLRDKDTLQRTCYSLSSTFLGRMCISGDICSLPYENSSLMQRSINFYQHVAHIIKNGTSFRYGPEIKSYRHPKGWQALFRLAAHENEALVIFHSFSNVPDKISFEIPPGKWQCKQILSATDLSANVRDNMVDISKVSEFHSCVLYLVRQGTK